MLPPCSANATTVARRHAIEHRLERLVGRPPAGDARTVLVINTIDRNYVSLIAGWKTMVDAAPFAKRTFVVAMDDEAAVACRAARVPYFAPSAARARESSSCLPGAPASRDVGEPAPGSYHKTKVQGKEADTRILPPDLPSWKMHSVLAGLSLGWPVLFSETDVLWLSSSGIGRDLLDNALSGGDSTFDFAPQRHPMTPVWNFGFFFARGPQATAFFECGVRLWERKQISARQSSSRGRAVDIGSDQRFLWELWRRRMCTPLRVRKLMLGRYPTCRDWVGKPPDELLVVHVTYCHRLSMLLSSEDVCKRRLMELWCTRSYDFRSNFLHAW